MTAARDDPRPPPEQFLSLIREQQRGRLKVYLGFAPGVGKTYEMLQEGHRLKQQGVDVVDRRRRDARPGRDRRPWSATWSRCRAAGSSTAAWSLEEMDLDAVLARRPTVVPGGRAGPHQRPGQPPRQALPGRRGAAPGRASTSSPR